MHFGHTEPPFGPQPTLLLQNLFMDRGSITSPRSEARSQVCVAHRTSAWSVSAAEVGTTWSVRREKTQSGRARSGLSSEDSSALRQVSYWEKILSQWSCAQIDSSSQAPAEGQVVTQLGGPYMIKEALPRNSYRLINADGVELPDPINALHLKRFILELFTIAFCTLQKSFNKAIIFY